VRVWHQTGGDLQVPENITIPPLPPYSLELNPMENYLRANKLCSLVWDSYAAIVAACKAAWDFLVSDPERISTIGNREWARVKV
jgi:hypothetical protein